MQDVILFFSVGYLYLFDCTENFKFQETKTTNGWLKKYMIYVKNRRFVH